MPNKSKKPLHKRPLFLLIMLFLIFGGILVFKGIKYLPSLYGLLFKKEVIELKKVEEQRINILLLGIGGGRHDGPLLTDTMMFASIDPEKNAVTLVSIPRDLWISNLQGKINRAYSDGEAKEEGGGLKLTKKVAEDVVGQQIDYGFRIDFAGFERAVDEIGGLEVHVERAFDDYAYPLSGKEAADCGLTEDTIASLSAQIATGSATELESFPCRYEHLHFDQGVQHMDGETTLKFVRSRHALGPEGTDFARSNRQEKVINAFKDKVFSAGTFLNPVTVVGLFDILKDSIDTDIKEDEFDDFIKLAQKMKEAKIRSAVVDFGDESAGREGLLIDPPINEEFRFQYVLIPRKGTDDFSEIHQYVSCMIKAGENCTVTPLPQPSGIE